MLHLGWHRVRTPPQASSSRPLLLSLAACVCCVVSVPNVEPWSHSMPTSELFSLLQTNAQLAVFEGVQIQAAPPPSLPTPSATIQNNINACLRSQRSALLSRLPVSASTTPAALLPASSRHLLGRSCKPRHNHPDRLSEIAGPPLTFLHFTSPHLTSRNLDFGSLDTGLPPARPSRQPSRRQKQLAVEIFLSASPSSLHGSAAIICPGRQTEGNNQTIYFGKIIERGQCYNFLHILSRAHCRSPPRNS